jgi:hypothetical protein
MYLQLASKTVADFHRFAKSPAGDDCHGARTSTIDAHRAFALLLSTKGRATGRESQHLAMGDTDHQPTDLDTISVKSAIN